MLGTIANLVPRKGYEVMIQNLPDFRRVVSTARMEQLYGEMLAVQKGRG